MRGRIPRYCVPSCLWSVRLWSGLICLWWWWWWWWQAGNDDDDDNNKQIYIALWGHNFRGAGNENWITTWTSNNIWTHWLSSPIAYSSTVPSWCPELKRRLLVSAALLCVPYTYAVWPPESTARDRLKYCCLQSSASSRPTCYSSELVLAAAAVGRRPAPLWLLGSSARTTILTQLNSIKTV